MPRTWGRCCAGAAACSCHCLHPGARDRFQAAAIDRIEARRDRAVQVEHADQPAVGRHQRHHALRARGRVAGDVPGECIDVRHQLGLAAARRRAAHALVQRDADAGRQALERADHQFGAVVQVEAAPVEVGQRMPQQRRQVGGIGDQVALAVHQRTGLVEQLGVLFGLVAGQGAGMERHAPIVATMAAGGGAMAKNSPDRGREVTRIEAFVDAAVAFAVTLLVISFDAMPDGAPALVDARKGVPAFAARFSLLAMLWWAHADWSRRFGLDDGRSVLLSLLMVFLVLVYVYPLRIIFSMFFNWASNGWLPSSVTIGPLRDFQVMFLAYALAWTTLGCVVVALYRHAWRLRDVLGLDREERIDLRGSLAAHAMIPATGVIALLVLLVLELLGWSEWSGFSGFAYSLMGFTGLAVARARRRAECEEGPGQP